MANSSISRWLFLSFLAGTLHAQEVTNTPAVPDTPTITARSSIVVLPALVRDKAGKIAFSLPDSAFKLTDDGVQQTLHLEEDAGGEPRALVVLIENGGDGTDYLKQYERVPLLVENMIGGVPHKVALVTFDSTPQVVMPFTEDLQPLYRAVHGIEEGDTHRNATLDALKFAVDMLAKQPVNYRRSILYIGETVDHGSSTTIEEAVRAVSNTNTAIYAVAFHSTRGTLKKEAGKALGGPAGHEKGCFSRDPNDPAVDLEVSRAEQTYDCLSLLAPPLRLAKIAYLAAVGGMAKNVPETVTRLTGGEYFTFKNTRSLEADLETLANHLPNRYILTFHPNAPHPGLHSLSLTLPDYPQLSIIARESYWAER